MFGRKAQMLQLWKDRPSRRVATTSRLAVTNCRLQTVTVTMGAQVRYLTLHTVGAIAQAFPLTSPSLLQMLSVAITNYEPERIRKLNPSGDSEIAGGSTETGPSPDPGPPISLPWWLTGRCNQPPAALRLSARRVNKNSNSEITPLPCMSATYHPLIANFGKTCGMHVDVAFCWLLANLGGMAASYRL